MIFIAFQQMREKDYRRNLLETRLHSYAEIVAASVERHGLNNDSIEFAQIAHLIPEELRLTVITRQGLVRYESDNIATDNMGNHKSRPEVIQALKNTEGSDIRLSETTGQEYFYYAKSYGNFLVRAALPYNTDIKDYMKADNLFLWFVLLLFPIILFILIRVSDKFGKSVTLLRRFISSAERGLVDYERISFPRSELGDIGQAILLKYKQQEDSARLIAAERERLMRHFHHFEEGIAIFSAERQKLYANPRFMQYVNTILTHPTADINTIWNEKPFEPAREFLDLQTQNPPHPLSAEVPFFRFTLTAGSNHFALQLLIYNDRTFEMTLTDITRAEKTRLLKQQMSNNITHELRTPVSSIRGYLETLCQCPNLADERKQLFIEKAHAQTIRLTDLIRDVSLITKTEEAPDLMPREEINLSLIAKDTIEELREELCAANMTVENRLTAIFTLSGNYYLIYSIFRNLMENSIRYAGKNTRLCLECYNEDQDYCYLRYYDTGCGVPEEHLSRLFERFYRVGEGRTKEGDGGTGLGLSIVRNAVFFHNGTISVRNRQGGGLEFLFTLKK